MSRIALRGARTRMRSRPSAGLTNICTVTSFGMSCANEALGSTTNKAVANKRTVREAAILLGMAEE